MSGKEGDVLAERVVLRRGRGRRRGRDDLVQCQDMSERVRAFQHCGISTGQHLVTSISIVSLKRQQHQIHGPF